MESKIKELEKILVDWDAILLDLKNRGCDSLATSVKGQISVLKMSIRILKEPSNQTIATDALCDECNQIGRNGEHSWYCRKCGGKLHR